MKEKEAKILMVHEVKPEFLDLDLSEFDIITFDDGLYSQYLYREHFLKFNIPLIYFISTGIICPEDKEQIIDIECSEAHRKWFCNKDSSPYMKWSQIKELNNIPGCKIGGHSHQHLKHEKGLVKLYNELSTDTSTMINEFKKNNINNINTFAYPYNKEEPLYRTILDRAGIKYVYGKGRIPIESLKGKK